MPQIDWTPEHKKSGNVEFDRLKLKVGERARIAVLEQPTFAFVHTLRAPKITDGRASKVVKKRKDGSEFADWDMDFVGRPQCLGDLDTLDQDGIDPKNCVLCARAKDSEEILPPDRRFAMNVIRYNTKADGSLVSPFGCSSVVWSYTEGVYNKLYEIAQEYGGLVGRDLVLGPCQPPENFQKFDISAGAKNVWQTDDQIKKIVLETHENNKLEVKLLEEACGRRKEVRWLKDDIDKIAKRWRIAHGRETGDSDGYSEKAEVQSLKGELDNLLAPPVEHQIPANPNAADAHFETGVTAEPAASPSEPDDFSKLLQGLKL